MEKQFHFDGCCRKCGNRETHAPHSLGEFYKLGDGTYAEIYCPGIFPDGKAFTMDKGCTKVKVVVTYKYAGGLLGTSELQGTIEVG